MSELGFDIGVGSDDLHSPNDSPIIVTKVNKGSVVDGRLRYRTYKHRQKDVLHRIGILILLMLNLH